MKYNQPMVKVSAADRDALLALAFSRGRKLSKAAQDAAAGDVGGKSRALSGAGWGALAGGTLGLINHLITPEDEDENRLKRALMYILGGAALGGVAGAGFNYFRVPETIHDTVHNLTSTEEPDNSGLLERGERAVLGGTAGYVGGKGVTAAILEADSNLGGTAFGAYRRPIRAIGTGKNVNFAADPSRPLGKWITPSSKANAQAAYEAITGTRPAGAWKAIGILSSVEDLSKLTPEARLNLAREAGLINNATFVTREPSWLGRLFGRRGGYVRAQDEVDRILPKAIRQAKTVRQVTQNLANGTANAGSRAALLKWIPRATGVLGALAGAATVPGPSDPNSVLPGQIGAN